MMWCADNIGQGSTLEMCYYLGKLQESNYLLSKAPRKKGDSDVMIRVPMLGSVDNPSVLSVYDLPV